MKWYKHDPDAFEAGTIELTLEETGAYILIINKLYSRDGDFPNSDYFGSRVLRCRPQTWRRLRDCLIAKGKLHVLPNGKLTANRVQTEVQTALKLIENMRVLGRVSAKKRNKIKANTPTGPLVTTTSTPTEREKNPLQGFSSLSLSVERALAPDRSLASALPTGALTRDPGARSPDQPWTEAEWDDERRRPGKTNWKLLHELQTEGMKRSANGK